MKSLIVLFLLFGNVYAEENFFCKNANDKLSQSIKSKIDSEIAHFSSLSEPSKLADETLSKLIQAKSPMIISWIKTRNLNPVTDAVTIATKWREYFAKNFLINKYPLGNQSVDVEIEKLWDRMNTDNLTQNKKELLEAYFFNAKKYSIEKINSYPFSDRDKRKIIEAINEIKLYFPKTLKGSKFEKSPLDFLDWGFAFDPTTKEINVGLLSLQYEFNETLESVLVHEIAHSFDSCRWGAFFEGAWPFEKIGTCLREIAKPRDDSKLEEYVKSNRITPELAKSLMQNPTCNKSSYPTIGIQADQLPETFADWFSAEVTASRAKENFRLDLCLSDSLNPGSSYLSNMERLTKIYLIHPAIKNKFNITTPSTTKYCTF